MNIGYSQLFTKKKVLNNENFDKPTISWGYFLGVNNYDFNFDYKVDLEDIQTEIKKQAWRCHGRATMWLIEFE